MTFSFFRVKVGVRKVATSVRRRCTNSLRRKKGPSSAYALVPSPSLDTPYPAPFHSAGPSFLSAAGLVACLKSPPHPQSTRQSQNHDLALNPRPPRVATVIPSPPPSSGVSIQHPSDGSPLPPSAVPIRCPIDPYPLPLSAAFPRGPGNIHILTAEELNAAIDRMLERLVDPPERQDERCSILLPVKQPTRPVVSAVQPHPSSCTAATTYSSSLPGLYIDDASKFEENRPLPERMPKPPSYRGSRR